MQILFWFLFPQGVLHAFLTKKWNYLRYVTQKYSCHSKQSFGWYVPPHLELWAAHICGQFCGVMRLLEKSERVMTVSLCRSCCISVHSHRFHWLDLSFSGGSRCSFERRFLLIFASFPSSTPGIFYRRAIIFCRRRAACAGIFSYSCIWKDCFVCEIILGKTK